MAGQSEVGRHTTTRYQQVDEGVVLELQQSYREGGDLRKAATWLSAEDRRTILAVSMDAGRVVGMPIQQLVGDSSALGEMTDFKYAVIAERLMTVTQSGHDTACQDRARDLLTAAACSPTASPLLAYEPLYRDLAETALLAGDAKAIDWLRRELAHNLHFHKGDDILFGLIDLASAHLQLGRLDDGLPILARLLQQDPSNQWVYRFMATGFGVLGLADLGLRGARKGLLLLDETGDPDDLHDELLMAEFDLQMAAKRGAEAAVSPAVLSQMDAALTLDFEAGDARLPAELGHILLPDLDDIPVKRPLRFVDLPLSVQALIG